MRGAEDLLDQATTHAADLTVVLEDLAGDVQRQVVGVHDTLDEAQVVGHERFAVVHDEHPLDVQLHAAPGLAGEQVEGCLRGDEQQRLVLEGAFGAHVDRLGGRQPVVADLLVELVVLVLGHLGARPGPQRLHRIERVDLVGGLALGVGTLGGHSDRPADEVRVLLDDLTDLRLGQVVGKPVLAVGGLEVQRDRGAHGQVVDGLDGVGALAVGLPLGTGVGTRPPGAQGDLVGNHERGVEAHAELPDQALGGGGVLGLLDLLQQAGRAGLGDGADQLHEIVPGHADPVVTDGQGAGVLVDLQRDVQAGGVDVDEAGVGQ